jgi:hypothetical protein
MTRRKDPRAELKEASIQDAIQKIKSKVFASAYHAANGTRGDAESESSDVEKANSFDMFDCTKGLCEDISSL